MAPFPEWGAFGQLVVVGMPPSGVHGRIRSRHHGPPGTSASSAPRWARRRSPSTFPCWSELYRARAGLKLDELVTRTYRLVREIKTRHRRREGRPQRCATSSSLPTRKPTPRGTPMKITDVKTWVVGNPPPVHRRALLHPS